MKLISMTDFVLGTESDLDKYNPIGFGYDIQKRYENIIKYANFLKQPLTLGMFVPCNKYGDVLEEPKDTNKDSLAYDWYHEQYRHKQVIYKQAKERVLFGNVSLQHAKWLFETYRLIEDITPIQVSMMPIYLTKEALKQIGL